MPGFSWSVLCHRLLYCLPFLVVSVKGACTWSAQSNTNVNAGDFNTDVTDLDGCKAACGDGCVAVTFSVDYFFPCKTFTTLPTDDQFEISSDYACCTYYTKTCVDDEATTDTGATTDTTTVPITNAPDEATTDTGATTDTTTVPITNAPGSGSCSMASKENKQVSSKPSKSLAVTDTFATCQKLCCCLSQCQAFSYDGRGGMCTLHTSTVTTTTTATGYKHGFKHGDNGCDFSVLENDKRVTSTSFFSINLQSQTDACKAMCVEINSCAALTVKPNTCVFNPDHSEPDQTDWYYYAKECTGSDPSTYTFATHCSGETVHLPKPLAVIAVWFVWIVTAMI